MPAPIYAWTRWDSVERASATSGTFTQPDRWRGQLPSALTMTSTEIRPPSASRKVEKPWGFETIFTEPGLPYVGKLIHVRAGSRLSLQVHDAKTETMTLISGRATLLLEQPDGTMATLEMECGRGYTVFPGKKHRLCGVTDAVVAEVSTPETGVTLRLDDDYGRPDERIG